MLARPVNLVWITALILCACTAHEIPLRGAELGTVQETCYLPDFDPGRFPWQPGECLNFEEVFKNYQYVEARLDRTRKQLDVRWFTQGKQVAQTRYLLR